MATKATTTSESALTPITVEMFSEKLAKHRISLPLLRQVIVAYQANLRHSNADTKRRGEVNGGGRKPWRQKGTGRARVGSSRTPLWRGGGIVFGPTPAKNYTQSITKTAKLQSLATALKLKVRAGLAHSVSMNDLPAKTKQAQLAIAPALTGGMVLIVVADTSKAKAFANIAGAKLMTPAQLTATWVSAARSVVFVGETWEATKAKFE